MDRRTQNMLGIAAAVIVTLLALLPVLIFGLPQRNGEWAPTKVGGISVGDQRAKKCVPVPEYGRELAPNAEPTTEACKAYGRWLSGGM